MKLVSIILLLAYGFTFAQQTTHFAFDKTEYEAIRLGYFHATLTINKDSTFFYRDWNHVGQTIKDSGKIVVKENRYYLNSLKKTTRKSRHGQSKEFYMFEMKEFTFDSTKITILPLDSIYPEYCTYYKK